MDNAQYAAGYIVDKADAAVDIRRIYSGIYSTGQKIVKCCSL